MRGKALEQEKLVVIDAEKKLQKLKLDRERLLKGEINKTKEINFEEDQFIEFKDIDNEESGNKKIAYINSLPLSRVEGLNMGQSQVEGVYLSTEHSNRYSPDAKLMEVDIKNPLIINSFDEFVSKRNDLLNKNKKSFAEGDFEAGLTINQRQKLSIDNLSDKGVQKLSTMMMKSLKAKGYDSVLFKETENQEGELVVFDKKFIREKIDKSNFSENDIIQWTATDETNPDNIYLTYKNLPETETNQGKEEWKSHILENNLKTTSESFNMFGDRNHLKGNDKLKRRFIAKKNEKGVPLDLILQDMQGDYMEYVSPSDIAQFMIDASMGMEFIGKETERQMALRRRYKEITGKSIKNHKMPEPIEQIPDDIKYALELEYQNNSYPEDISSQKILDILEKNKDLILADFMYDNETYGKAREWITEKIKREKPTSATINNQDAKVTRAEVIKQISPEGKRKLEQIDTKIKSDSEKEQIRKEVLKSEFIKKERGITEEEYDKDNLELVTLSSKGRNQYGEFDLSLLSDIEVKRLKEIVKKRLC